MHKSGTASLMAVLMAGTIAAGSIATADIRRTADGKPDFSGFYDIATITPLQRPQEFGDNLYLTPERAAAMAAERAQLMAAETLDPDREAPPAGGDGSTGAAGNVGGYDAFWIDAGEEAVLVDGRFRTSIISAPASGRQPARTPAGTAKMMKRFAPFLRENEGVAWWLNERDGSGPYDDPELRPLAERCIVGFAPTAPILPSLYNNHKRIVQTPTHVMILNEMVHDVRIIRIDAEHMPGEIRRWLGDSVGWWEGDTLVVDTKNFNDTPHLQASRDLRVIERFSPGDDGNLVYAFTVEDPTTWTASWGGEYTWPATDEPVYEYACHEGNYSFGNILRGARRLEADALASGAE